MLLCLGTAVHANQTKTFYDHIQDSWAFGVIDVIDPMKYRDGRLLAFPGRISELIHARYGKPRSVLVVHEVVKADDPVPFEKGRSFVAPLRVLPRTKYWRDNLPTTPRHEVLGGSRYAFSGDDVEGAKALGKAWAETLDMGMPDRKLRQGEIVAGALSSATGVLSEDSVNFLTGRTLTHITEKAYTDMLAFAGGDAPAKQRVGILDAIGRAGLTGAKPGLEKLAEHEDSIGAAALRALSLLGTERPTDEVAVLAKSKSGDVRAWAFGELAARSGDDSGALASVAALLESDDAENVRSSACDGLGRTGSDKVVPALRGALFRGDDSSRAAAMALAKVGSAAAVGVLKKAVAEGPSEAMIGSVVALKQVGKPCADCEAFLRQQHETHEDGAIRDLIAIVMQFNSPQKN